MVLVVSSLPSVPGPFEYAVVASQMSVLLVVLLLFASTPCFASVVDLAWSVVVSLGPASPLVIVAP